MTGTINPALFGMPDATTAGVPSGTTLTAYTGPMTITQAGTVIEGKIIDGTLTVDASNVTIKNCIIKNYGMWGIDGEGAANLTVLNCDFTASTSKDTNAAILGSGTFIGNDISQSENGIVLQGGASVVRDNFVASGSGQDTIQFSKTVFDSFANVLTHASQVGEDVAISTGNDTLVLKNTKLGALTSNDFHFA